MAWQRLVHLYTPLVYGWCRRTGLQEADALDVGQDVFKSVWSNIQGFRREQPGDTFRGWLRIIVRNKLNDFHRRKDGEPVAQGGSELATRMQEEPASVDLESNISRKAPRPACFAAAHSI